MKRFLQLLTAITQFGAPQDDPDLYKRVVFSNRLGVLLLVFCVFYSVAMATEGLFFVAISLIGVGLLYPIISLLNAYKRHYLASVMMVIVPSTAMLLYSVLLGEGSGVQYFLLPMTGFPLIIFKHEDRLSMLFGFSVPTIFFFLVYWIQSSGLVPPQPFYNPPDWCYRICLLGCFVLTAFIYKSLYETLNETQAFVKKNLEEKVEERTIELQQANELYALASKATNETIYEWDIPTHTVRWNDSYFQVFGYTKTKASAFYSAEDWVQSIHPDDRERIMSSRKDLMECGESFWSSEYHMRRANGSYAYVLDRGYLTRDANGNPSRMVGSILDVSERRRVEEEIRSLNEQLEDRVRERTIQLQISNKKLMQEIGERKKTEQALREASEHFLQISNNIEGVLWVGSLSGDRLYYLSPSAERVFGYPCESFFQDPLLWIVNIYPEDRAKIVEDFAKAIEGEFNAVYRIIHPKDQSIHWISNRASIIKDEEGNPSRLIGVALDVTKQKESEELVASQQLKMINSSKLSALGEMAGGIAHEINNPLAIIHGKAGLILEAIKAQKQNPEKMQKAMEVILSTVDRISKIIRSMRAFSRDVDKDPFAEVSVKQIVDDTLELCRERFKDHNIIFKVDDIPPDLKIECRAVQISQVLLNLLNNAYDAAEGQPDSWVRLEFADEDLGVEVSITDSGLGLPAEIHEKIFQPFFTTKEIGKGTGLGLSVSSGIIRAHSGRLWLDSEYQNTRFVFWLPKKQPASLGIVKVV